MRILITGGAGFIGSHVADILLNAGHEIIIADNLTTGSRENIPDNTTFRKMDIRDDDIADLFAEYRFDAVVHHAAQVSVRDSVKDPLQDLDINVKGSVHLLNLCQTFKVKKFIFASTGGVIYGEQDYFPADEKHPVRPISPYGVAKQSVERYMFFFHKQYEIDAVALRYTNVYGPRQNPHGEAGVIAIFTKSMIAGESTIINGDGDQTRDYVFIEDVARANLEALSLSGFHTLNICTGVETSVNKLFERLTQLTGSKAEPLHNPAAPGDQLRSVLDNQLAFQVLGWQPTVTLDTGLERTVEFFRNR